MVVHSREDVEGTKQIVDQVRSAGGRAIPAIAAVEDRASAWALVERIVAEWAQLDVVIADVAGLVPEMDQSDASSTVPPALRSLLDEVTCPLNRQEWGRVVLLFQGPAARGHTTARANSWIRSLESHYAPPRLLNAVVAAPGATGDGVARTLLFLGSGWNTAVSGAVLPLHA